LVGFLLVGGDEPVDLGSAGAPLRDGIDPASFVGLTAVGTLLLIVGAALLERRDVLC